MSGQEWVGTKKQGRYFMSSCQPGSYLVYDPPFDLFEFHSRASAKKVSLGYSHGKLLESLVCCDGLVVTREKLFASGWPDRVVTQNSLNQAIFLLRQFFGDVDGVVIKTIPRRGYTFNPDYLLSNSCSVVEMLEKSVNSLIHQPVDALSFNEAATESFHVGDDAITPLHTTSVTPIHVLAKKSLWKRFSFRYIFIVFLIILALSLAYRFYYMVEEETWFDSKLVVGVEQSFLFVGSDAAEVEKIQLATEALRQRFMALAHEKSYLVFNKMHNYVDIVCLSPKNKAKFILVHEERADSISDEQISECLK